MNTPVELGLGARPSQTWRLIDLIYETGQHPERWPVLLESLVNVFSVSANDALRSSEADEISTSITRHLQQALALNQYIGEHENVLHTAEPLLATLSFPLVVVDQDLRVLYTGDAYSGFLHASPSLNIDNGFLHIRRSADRECFERVLAGGRNAELLEPLADLTNEASLSICVLPVQVEGASPLALIAWFDVEQRGRHSCEKLAALYGLTETEASLLNNVIADHSYSELAELRGVSENTIRSQVKQIFAKTESHSRAELIQKVLCGPELLNRLVSHCSDDFFSGSLDDPRRNQTIQIRSGERLGFAEYGPPDGEPVVLIHNVSGSRLQIPVPEDRFYEQGIRLILPDRPGIGLSDAPDDFSMRYWTEAFEQLLDHLNLDRSFLVGTSMGGVYALAAAAAMPQRFERLSLVSTMAEIDTDTDSDQLETDLRRVLALGKRVPRITRLLLQLAIRDLPSHYLDRRILKLPKADQVLYRNPAFYQMSIAALKENMRGGVVSMVRDFLLLAAPWEFSVEAVTTPVQIWHGLLDISSPFCSIERLVERLPNCECFYVPRETHMLIYRHWNTITACLLNPELATPEMLQQEFAVL